MVWAEFKMKVGVYFCCPGGSFGEVGAYARDIPWFTTSGQLLHIEVYLYHFESQPRVPINSLLPKWAAISLLLVQFADHRDKYALSKLNSTISTEPHSLLRCNLACMSRHWTHVMPALNHFLQCVSNLSFTTVEQFNKAVHNTSGMLPAVVNHLNFFSKERWFLWITDAIRMWVEAILSPVEGVLGQK